MTDKEKNRLLEAFGIPEPDRKNQFTEEFRQRSHDKVKKPLLPIIMRTAASAAMLALIIGAVTHLPKQNIPAPESEIVITATETTSAAASSVTDNSDTFTTASSKNIKTTTTKAVTTKTGTKAESEVTVRTTLASSNSESSHTHKAAENTSAADIVTTALTSAPTASENSAATAPPQTTQQPESVIRDMTVTPDIIYPVRSKVIREDALNDGGIDKGNDGNSGIFLPLDQKIQKMFDNSYDIILAKVDKIVYTSIDGEVYSAEDIIVEKTYKGGLSKNDKITLFIRGGLMPAEEYINQHRNISLPDAENYSVKVSGMYDINMGDTYLFFINKSDNAFPSGSFILSYEDDEAVFRQHNDRFVSLRDNVSSFDSSLLRQ